MTLEAAIHENTAAIRELTALITASMQDAQRSITAEPQEIPAQLRKAKATPKPAAAPSPEPTPTASDNPENSSTASEKGNVRQDATVKTPAGSATDGIVPTVQTGDAATYEDVRKALRTLYDEKGRDATADAPSRFGAATVKDLLPEYYGPFVALCNEATNGDKV